MDRAEYIRREQENARNMVENACLAGSLAWERLPDGRSRLKRGATPGPLYQERLLGIIQQQARLLGNVKASLADARAKLDRLETASASTIRIKVRERDCRPPLPVVSPEDYHPMHYA